MIKAALTSESNFVTLNYGRAVLRLSLRAGKKESNVDEYESWNDMKSDEALLFIENEQTLFDIQAILATSISSRNSFM